MTTPTFGYRATVQILDQNKALLHEEKCASNEELQTFLQTYGNSKERSHFLFYSFVPLRTDNANNFAQDFFFPNFLSVLRTDNLVVKLIAALFAIAFDLATFPVRLIALPFRIWYNSAYPETPHPMLTLIKESPEIVTVECSIYNLEEDDDDEEGYKRALGYTAKLTMDIALKRFPGWLGSEFYEKHSGLSYMRDNKGEWVCEQSGATDFTESKGSLPGQFHEVLMTST